MATEALCLSRSPPQARSQDFCVGGRFEQKVDLFVLFFLSVKGGGGAGSCLRDFVLNPCAAKSEYIRFKQISD